MKSLGVLRKGLALLARMRADVFAACANDPAARSPYEVAATYPGVHALWGHRIAHELWSSNYKFSARSISFLNRFVTGIEIHPGARIGDGVFIDHGMGVVIGETTTVGDGTLIYKGVVLGGVSLDHCVRHPQVGPRVVIGSNACILGNIEIGEGAKIGSGSVVVKPVPAGATVVGVPARVVRKTADPNNTEFVHALDHANLPDPLNNVFLELAKQNEQLRQRLEHLEQTLARQGYPTPSPAPPAFPNFDGG